MLKWIPGVLIAAAFIASAILQARLASPVMIGFHRLIPPELAAGTETVPRLVALFGIPSVALLLWALLYEAPVSRLGLAAGRLFFNAEKPRYEAFAPTYRLMVLWVVSLVLSFHLALLAEALQWSLEPGRIVGVTFGLGMLLVGNAMPRLRQNAVAGFRTARTMSDPVAWARVHRTFGGIWLVAGFVVLFTSVIAPRYALAAAVALLLLSSVVGLVATRRFALGESSVP